MCKIHRKTPVSEFLFLIMLQVFASNYIKKGTLTMVFSCKFCEISKNNFFADRNLDITELNWVKYTGI